MRYSFFILCINKIKKCVKVSLVYRMKGGAREDLYWQTSLQLKQILLDNARIVRLVEMETDRGVAGVYTRFVN